MDERVESVERRVDRSERRIDRLEEQADFLNKGLMSVQNDVVQLHRDLLDNTKVTREIQAGTESLVKFGQGAANFRKGVILLGGIAGALVAIWKFWDMYQAHILK